MEKRHGVLALVMMAGCSSFRLPMTAEALAAHDSGPALLAYLGQADASGAVCTDHSLSFFTPELERDLVSALVDGKVRPEVFGDCVEAALPALAAEPASSLLDALAGGEEHLLRQHALETDPSIQQCLQRVHGLILERAPGTFPHPAEVAPRMKALEQALAQGQLGPIGAAAARELVESEQLDRGLRVDRPVDRGTIEALAAAKDERSLGRLAQRLPSADLREASARRLIELRLERSPFAELRAQASEVEERVLRTGVNAVSLATNPVQRAWFDERALAPRTVLVQPSPAGASLLAVSPVDQTLSVLPAISTRGALWAQLASLSGPVTVCGPASDLDPTPCLSPLELSSASPLFTRDARGDFHLAGEASAAEAVALAASPTLRVPLQVGSAPADGAFWNLRYARPAAFVFAPGNFGAPGPALQVRVEQLPSDRFFFSVRDALGTHLAVLEHADLPAFRVISRGGAGADGSAGTDGVRGEAGGECSNGGAGGDGAQGQDGAAGGNGGAIAVTVSCGDGRCSTQTLATLQQVIRSEGGAGGSGGTGGDGGAGGAGGPRRAAQYDEATHSVSDPGCEAGAAGRYGRGGAAGNAGSPGAPGARTFTVLE